MKLGLENVGVWLINLRQDVKRRAKMDDQLREFGLDYTIFPAIDGRLEHERLNARVDSRAYRRNMGSQILPGKMGVYCSHLTVWEALCASPFAAGLVLEDDVIFHEDFVDALEAALAVASNWDLVRFCCIRAKLPVSQGRIGRYQLNAYVGPFTGNAAYLVQKSAAVRIMPGLWPQTRALDHELNRFNVHNYRLRGLEPFACHPDDGGLSTITGKHLTLVQKENWYKRLPYYMQKTSNYVRRAAWLMRGGSVPGTSLSLR